MTIDSHRPERAVNTTRKCLSLVAGIAIFAVGLVGSASATFPGSNGPILFRDDHPSSGTGSPLFRARADGSQTRMLSKRPGLFSDWRPDGGRIAFDFFQRDGSEQIATMRRDGRDLKVISAGKGIHEVPSYSPDGRSLAFDASRQDPSSPSFQTHLWVMRADGSRAHRLAMASSGFDAEPRYAPNGRWIVFNRFRPTPRGQLLAAFVVSTTGKHRVHRLTPWSLGAEHPTWSPDSRWILYNSPEGTVQRVRLSGTGRQTLMAASDGFGGHKPWYSPDGTKILFMCENQGTLRHPPANYNQDICVMNADGSNIVHIIDTPNVLENWPSWGPTAR
jgi:Tol biopolymer transport system component